ncbi:MAG TPA: FAD-dependent oxidoreductase [Pirellulaceae bacterium]|nr:FAD-dependent oxidoreductase [Pirellulaceae bacterium]HMO90991.1 FAD-dependent oxidoreductase [Pirellulaceae bacterium]HMP68106.1 FAD-dependent oxidoreductase [Pirellulaceae bacterium]
MANPNFTVLGCGVIGLTTAIRLLETFACPTRIIARDLPPATTSNIAAAIWMPFLVEPADKALLWSKHTFDVYETQQSMAATGIYMSDLFEFFEELVPLADWATAIRNYRHARAEEIPDGFNIGYVYEVPIIETPYYMPYLIQRFSELGGEISVQTVHAIEDVSSSDSITVNCTGLGAGKLLNDHDVFPIRGQILRMESINSRRSLTIDTGEHAITYIIPRSNDTIIGGTTLSGIWDTAVDPATSQRILASARYFEPRLRDAVVLEEIVGLRPGRTKIRLEIGADRKGHPIIHNYGHGGSGFTLCWGCADAVCDLVATLRSTPSISVHRHRNLPGD